MHAPKYPRALHLNQPRIFNCECPKASVLRRSPARSGKYLSSQHQKPAARWAEHTNVSSTRKKLVLTRQCAARIRAPVAAGRIGPIALRCPLVRQPLRTPTAVVPAAGRCAAAAASPRCSRILRTVLTSLMKAMMRIAG